MIEPHALSHPNIWICFHSQTVVCFDSPNKIFCGSMLTFTLAVGTNINTSRKRGVIFFSTLNLYFFNSLGFVEMKIDSTWGWIFFDSAVETASLTIEQASFCSLGMHVSIPWRQRYCSVVKPVKILFSCCVCHLGC